MRITIWTAVLLVLAIVSAPAAEPIRVAIMDFEDQTGQQSDAKLGGTINPAALAAKGVTALTRDLVGAEGFVLIDRRDFINQIEKAQPMDSGKPAAAKPTFVQAAQALNADAVLRGYLESFSTGKQVINQGGYKTEFATLSLRLSVQALDPVDGTVIAVADGVARNNIRQTDSTYTEISEDDALDLMDQALAKAVPQLRKALEQRQAREAARPRVKLNIKTSADPAMVEVDGLLVGTTPLEGLQVYQGDHVLTIGKPGYRDITKRIMLEKDTAIEVPMIRTELSADEMKEILEKARLNIISTDGIEPALIIKDLE
ncbi:MAG: PEGA domain protein [Verrucomicrobia bacterium ADurb.Bin345]|nr:MAG: PEGA domain protein [Verrucomicrobia bacterium ADurb.Bin345]